MATYGQDPLGPGLSPATLLVTMGLSVSKVKIEVTEHPGGELGLRLVPKPPQTLPPRHSRRAWSESWRKGM